VTTRARLIETAVPVEPAGVVLVLHGGASRQHDMRVSPTQLSVLRMVPIAKRIARAGSARLAVFRLLNSVRGWDSQHTPVQDAAWALDEIRSRLGVKLPTALVGHSLGGRAALLAADRPEVVSVVALAPWVYATDASGGLPGRRVLIVHGSADRIARPENSAAVARALAATTDVGYVRILGGKHAMLRHHTEFDGLAADFVTATVLGSRPGSVIARIFAGERWIDIS
jgi:pimeloyl-ACP methyl ester carboxylesterase